MSIIQVFKPTSGPISKGIINVPEPDDEFAFTRAEKLKLAHLSTGSTGELITLVSDLTEIVNNNYNLLTGETSDRIIGDIINYNLITGETSNRISGETAINVRIDNLPTGSTNYIEITYSEILNLANISGLTINQSYLITDYQTVHYIVETTDLNTGPIEPLLVKTNSSSSLYPEAYSVLYPQDIIYYNLKNKNGVVPGCTKGYITRRVDTVKNNDFPFDFRNIKNRRWRINITDIWVSGLTYTVNMIVLKNGTDDLYICIKDTNISVDITNLDYWRLFEFKNLSYIATNPSWYTLGNIYFWPTSEYLDYNYFSNPNYYETSYNNTIKGGTNANNILTGNNNVIFGNYFSNNTIGDNFGYNNINTDFSYNTIKGNFNGNSIGNTFSFNTIGAGFVGNTFSGYVISNNFGESFMSNSLHSSISYNTFIGEASQNTIGF